MTFEPLGDHFVHHHEHSHASPATPPAPSPSASSSVPASSPVELFLSDVPEKPLTWLWPGRIPLGHLTLLDAAPACDPSLLALTLAACVSSGNPLPGGEPTTPATVILFAPYDSASATIKPRLQAAGGDPTRVLLFRPPFVYTSHTQSRAHAFALSSIIDHLSSTIRRLNARLLILDPASAIPGLLRCLPALSELAQQTGCAILLTRSLNKPPANILHPSGPASPLCEAICSRLLLITDPADERHHLLLTTRHSFCVQPAILAYDLLLSDGDIPAIRWLAEQDHTHLARLSTAPLHSPQRQAILRFLHQNPGPQSIADILAATCYDRESGRKMLTRMKLAGELICTARGLYTTPTADSLPVPDIPPISDSPISTVPTEPDVPTPPPSTHQAQSSPPDRDVPSFPAISLAEHITSPVPTDFHLSHVPDVPNPPEETCPAQPHIHLIPKIDHTTSSSLKESQCCHSERVSRSPERSEGEESLLRMTGEETPSSLTV